MPGGYGRYVWWVWPDAEKAQSAQGVGSAQNPSIPCTQTHTHTHTSRVSRIPSFLLTLCVSSLISP
jgi:hypothetical protein